MTRHRSKDEWITEILQAAACEIEENGFASFSMEAVIRRTQLSKGGVYRFFRNRQELALALFASCYEPTLHFSVDACLAWNVSAEETFFRLISRFNAPEDDARRVDRLWLRLIPEVLGDHRFQEIRGRLLQQIHEKFLVLAHALAKRDQLTLSADFDAMATDAIAMGVGLMEGFAVQSALGNSMEHLGNLTRRFVAGLVTNLMTSPGAGDKQKSLS